MKGQQFPIEPLPVALLLSQDIMIDWLTNQISIIDQKIIIIIKKLRNTNKRKKEN